MRIRVLPSATGGEVKAIASKSAAHRLLICAAFAKGDTVIGCEEINEDISATVRCLTALGAKIERRNKEYFVSPVRELKRVALLDCGESGSTMRFLVPVACMLGADASFLMSGRLPMRPLSPLREELERCGIEFTPIGSNPLVCKGRLRERDFSIDGDVSSQFISGLLFAIAASGEGGKVRIKGRLESKPYIDLTADTLGIFGVKVTETENGYEIAETGGLISPSRVETEGDWSNAAFPLCMGAIGKSPVTVNGLNLTSSQGDKQIIDILCSMGARVETRENSVTVYPSVLSGVDIDASQIPDLVPILAVAASSARGRTVIYNAGRLRIKESDRLRAVSHTLNSLGADVTETEDGLSIEGRERLSGGEVSAYGDHRIVMSAAVAALRCDSEVVIDGAEAVSKSYPAFFEDMAELGVVGYTED